MYDNIETDRVRKSVGIIELSGKDALDSLMSNDFYCTTELPEYFDFSGVLRYAADSIGNQSLEECGRDDCMPESVNGVNLDVITNKDGRYAVRPLTLANPFLYYMLARDICNENSWTRIKECFKLYKHEHITACAIPMVKVDDKPEPFKGATSILNWWNSMEQRSIELSLKYRYMFITDITNCFGQINPESIGWALARKGTPHETTENTELSSIIQRYLRAMQEGKNIGIPQGSSLFSLIAEIILGYTDMLLAQEIANEQEDGNLPKDLEYEILRYVDDYRIFCNDRDALDKISYLLQHILERFNFRMNSSKTRTSSELITDSIKPDKAYYIFNTPIESK
ncbi:MAG: RNA-directed DNA polymerase, partial [Muribaculaceae bacterium]|nr:RNA-directed DNA polymerase [Muribaculaceae bacterium]